MSRVVRRVHLERDEDVSGVSGVGKVAYGCVFPDGAVVLRWDTEVSSTTIYNSVSDLLKIVGHGGRTRLVWDDDHNGVPFNLLNKPFDGTRSGD